MRKLHLLVSTMLAISVLLICGSLQAETAPGETQPVTPKSAIGLRAADRPQLKTSMTDRWIECDLLWFKPDDIQGRVNAYFDRIGPLYDRAGENGIVLNPGWLVDIGACWTGNLDEPLALTKWKLPGHQYPSWTGRAFKDLISSLKATAANRGFADFKVVVWFFGKPVIYDLAYSEWTTRHPETYKGMFNATLSADTHHYAAYPNGIPAGTLFGEFFARQVGELCKATGLDGLELRDFLSFQTAYTIPSHVWNPKVFGGVRAFLKEFKTVYPAGLCIGYNSAGPATGDLRGQSFDAESLAAEGLLDRYVASESWGVAWNEFYQQMTPRPECSYAAEQAYEAVTQAQLARTKCRVLPLVELTGGWEYDDTPLTRSRFNNRMQSWLYANSFYAAPDGRLLPPQGLYLAIADRARQSEADSLILQEQVAMVKTWLDRAALASQGVEQVYGCRLFYNRDALLWINENANGKDLGEFADHHFSFLMNHNIPSVSSARIEDFDLDCAGEFPVLFTPFRLSAETIARIKAYNATGKPMLVIGAPKTIDEALRQLPHTLYWNPMPSKRGVVDLDAASVAAQIIEMMKANGLSYQSVQQYGVWPIWKSKGVIHMQVVNFEYDREKARPKDFTLHLSRKQLGLDAGEYHLQGLYDQRKIGAERSDKDYITYQVAVPPFSSFICTLQPGAAPKPPTIINDDDPSVVYTGQWTRNDQALVSYHRNEHVSANPGDAVELKFQGSSVRVFGTRNKDRGIADIYLDGKKVEQVNQFMDWVSKRDGVLTSAHSTSYLKKYLQAVIPEEQVIYSASDLTAGPHTIRIVVTGQKDPKATAAMIGIDAFEITPAK